MKKIFFTTLALFIFLVGSFAKTPTHVFSDRKLDRKDLRKDHHDMHKDRMERKKAFTLGKKQKGKELTKGIKADKKEIREDRKDRKEDALRHHGKKG